MTNRPSDTPELDRLPDHLAQRVLARASEIDAAGAAVTDLRAAAREAGISPAAFEAALAEVQGVTPPTLQAEKTPAVRPRRRISAAMVGAAGMLIFLVMAVFIPRAVQRSGPAGDEVAITERIFRLNCLSPGEAGLLLRPLMTSPYSTVISKSADAPNVLIVRGTQEEIQRAKALLDQRDPAAGRACPAPTVAR